MPTEAGGRGQEGDRLGGLWQISGEHSAFVRGWQLLGLSDDCCLGVEPLCGQLYQMASKEIRNLSFGVKSEMLNVDNLL